MESKCFNNSYSSFKCQLILQKNKTQLVSPVLIVGFVKADGIIDIAFVNGWHPTITSMVVIVLGFPRW